MVNQNTNGLGFARLRDHYSIGDFVMSECALRVPEIFTGGLLARAVGMAQGRIVPNLKGLPPPKKR